jgi:hypothetical protein
MTNTSINIIQSWLHDITPQAHAERNDGSAMYAITVSDNKNAKTLHQPLHKITRPAPTQRQFAQQNPDRHNVTTKRPEASEKNVI